MQPSFVHSVSKTIRVRSLNRRQAMSLVSHVSKQGKGSQPTSSERRRIDFLEYENRFLYQGYGLCMSNMNSDIKLVYRVSRFNLTPLLRALPSIVRK